MKRRGHIYPFICLVTITLSLAAAAVVSAQGFMPPPPSQLQMQPMPFAPTSRQLFAGLFYAGGGVKWRNIVRIRSEVQAHTLSMGDLGAVPFGPEQAGFVGYPYDTTTVPMQPTGLAGDSPTISGIWQYDDGLIDPNSAVAPSVLYNPPFLALGHYNVPPTNVGHFVVEDPLNQTDNGGGIYSGTTTVTLTKKLDAAVAVAPSAGRESLIFVVNSDPGTRFNWTEKIWTPYLEAGYQAGNFFDVFVGFSWFNLIEKFQRTYQGQASISRRAFADTFAFESSNSTQNWLGNFDSDIPDPNDNPDTTQSYVIFPIGRSGGRDLPTRTFFIANDPTVPLTPVSETVFNSFEFTPIEFRFGGRSWVPLYGLGKFGYSLGALWAIIPYTSVTHARVVATADNAAAGIVAGDVLIDVAHKQQDLWANNVGAFMGADLELNMNRFFLRTGAEYNAYFLVRKYDQGTGVVSNQLDIGGVSGTFAMGARF